MKEIRLLLARHGETNANVDGIIQGPVVDQPLNARGKAQAAALARHLAKHDTPRAIYASPLLRAHETAAAVADALALPLTPLPTLHEVSWGEFNGQRKTAEISHAMDGVLRAWDQGDLAAHTPGGETPHDVWKRAQEAVLPLVKQHDGETVLVVGHGRINKVLLSGLLHGDLHHMEDYPQPNAGYTTLTHIEDRWRLDAKAGRAHLGGLEALDERAG